MNALLADLILTLHVLIVAFVVGGQIAIIAGGLRRWGWIRGRAFRYAHLATIAFIATQAWLGQLCPLTVWEQALRQRAGQATYAESFVEHWLSRVLYVDAPWWAFVAGYTAFALVAVVCWWKWPPKSRESGIVNRESGEQTRRP